MPTYTVHIYREMRLRFDDIAADSPEAAAEQARERVLFEADAIDDCDGETFAAVVDYVPDNEPVQSTTIDFEAGKLWEAAPRLLEALKLCREQLSLWVSAAEPDGLSPEDDEAFAKAQTAIACAEG